MNTQTLEKMNKLSRDIINLKRTVTGLEGTIKDIRETGHFYRDETVLIFERQVSTNEEPSVEDVYSALSVFKGLLETPAYKDGYNVYDGECLLVERCLITSESGEDCHIKIVVKTEPVSWEDWDEDNTYLQVWHDCSPTKEQCSLEVVSKEKELSEMKLLVEKTETELNTLMEGL